MKDHISLKHIQALLENRDPLTTEKLARQAAVLTQQYFGRTVSLYAPLYLSNYCSSYCTYCGFNSRQRIRRIKLTPGEIQSEMQKVADTGIENILLLTGESYQATPLSYLLRAVEIAGQHFTGICLEVHPMDTEDYHTLYLHGVDAITLYQETYDRKRYQSVHLSGKKKDYDYRYTAIERIAQAGMRYISMGILLGLGDVAEDLYSLFRHLRWMEKAYPAVEYSLSFPRLRQIRGQEFCSGTVDDITFTKIICLTRLLFPRVGINLSTRESPRLRDHLIECGVTRLSAGSNTAVGGYSVFEQPSQDPQFDIQDKRAVQEIVRTLKSKNFDPVFTDWRPIKNT